MDQLLIDFIYILTPASYVRPHNGMMDAMKWRNEVGMPFVLIAAGTFEMGSKNGDEGELPVHPVTVNLPFYMGVHVVTQGQWKEVMGTEPWAGQFFVQEGHDYPATHVSWEDTQAFIKTLNARDNAYSYRLPTEAEWEYACRAESNTEYCCGNDERMLKTYSWYEENAYPYSSAFSRLFEHPHPVGQKQPNLWGLCDMHGNVWEWVEDWYGPYPAESVMDPLGPFSGPGRVIRGGDWDSPAEKVRSAFRGYAKPNYYTFRLGFRLVRMTQ